MEVEMGLVLNHIAPVAVVVGRTCELLGAAWPCMRWPCMRAVEVEGGYVAVLSAQHTVCQWAVPGVD